MACVSLLLLGAYAAIGVALLALYEAEPSWGVYVTIIALAIGCTVVGHYLSATEVLLRTAGVRLDASAPALAELEKRIARLAALADLSHSASGSHRRIRDANAFTVGVRQKRAVVVVTSGLYHRLEELELDAVLAHELSHIANRDAAVMSLASVPRSIGATIAGAGSDTGFYLWFFIWPLGLIP